MIAIAIAWFLLGLLLLALGGDSIVKAVSGLAQRFGATPFTAGLLLLGLATSLPELAVNARALAVGQPELALGNAVGSSIANLGLTLAMAALAAPLLLRARLQTVLWWSLLAAGMLLILFGLDGRLARWEGGVLVAGFIVMQVVLLRRGRSENAEVQAVIAESALSRTSLPLNVLRVLIAALALYWGARLVVGLPPTSVLRWAGRRCWSACCRWRSAPRCRKWPPPSPPRAGMATWCWATYWVPALSTCCW